jgi:hypothetical protein
MLTVIFSCDRAMQLDATLRSLLNHCLDIKSARFTVIYKCTNETHTQQYVRLSQEYSSLGNIHFHEQADFRKDLLNILIREISGKTSKAIVKGLLFLGPQLGYLANLLPYPDLNKKILFLVDDNIFVRDFFLQKSCDLFTEHQNALGFSLRLGTNTTYCYTLDKPQALPDFQYLTKTILKYKWTNADADFGYPLEISSSIYRLSDILPLLMNTAFSNPNTLEAGIAAKTRRFKKYKPYLLCYTKSVTFCAPINKVQNVYTNKSGNLPQYSSEHLAEMFEHGYRIDVKAYNEFESNSCHQEVDLFLDSNSASK